VVSKKEYVLKLAICLPVYNEAECIVDYLEEVRTSFASVDFSFFLVNDSSTDLTLDTISRYRKEHSNVWVESNKINMGHGKTTLNAVLFALDSSPEMLLTVDGDGQVAGNSLRNLYEAFSGSNLNYGEGVRVERIDPWFRKLISFLTRVMVFLWAGTNTSDANTPIRIYTVEAAKKFWTPMIHVLPGEIELKFSLMKSLGETD
jgi:glycosyltransferase involved in cell wall biosynthesis